MQSSYGDESFETWLEKAIALPIYVLRKVNLAVVLGLLGAARALSKPFAFEFRGEVRDRETWQWGLLDELPVYRARIEKKQ